MIEPEAADRDLCTYRFLRHRSDRLVGPPAHQTASGHTDDGGFRATYLPSGDIIVTLTDTCDLATVYDLCRIIAHDSLEGTGEVDFTRDPTEADTRIRTFGQTTEPGPTPSTNC